ncbi:hypothetical protein HPB52_016118 [Rhipicephalus sanguineus]|uniref:SMP-30/Gluconolactonase/LRE-like region domain-containing protein n=1 Tax=Rhipicephalus sanguineus TaxID=34632 RepID=A0A9D4QGW9_RHISA|nr:hypothetical protein HPB52_016118 [Rhipicephalus sanguineus]
MKVEAVGQKRYTLGEGPHWDERSGTLLFVDGHGCQIFRYDPESRSETEVVRLEDEIGNFIPYAEDNRKLVVCMGRGVYRLDLDTMEKTLLTEMLDEESPVPTRINDGKCDAVGRLWAGSMPVKIDTLDVEGMARGKNNLWSFSKGNKRILLDFKATPGFQELGHPDGMTIDVNDKIWLTCCLSGLVLQVDPETGKSSSQQSELRYALRHVCQLPTGCDPTRRWPPLPSH